MHQIITLNTSDFEFPFKPFVQFLPYVWRNFPKSQNFKCVLLT